MSELGAVHQSNQQGEEGSSHSKPDFDEHENEHDQDEWLFLEEHPDLHGSEIVSASGSTFRLFTLLAFERVPV
jgi:hypothetical protein